MTTLSPHQERGPQNKRAWIKRATVALPLLCLLIFGTFIGVRLATHASSASADSLTQLPGYVPALVSKSTLVGPIDSNQSLSISIGLQLRNVASLKSYIDSTSRPKSVTGHQHLTPAQIAAGYAPLPSSQQAVIDFMQGYGFQVTTTTSQHLIVGFKGTASDVEKAFHIQINNYRSPTGQNFYAPANNPAVPTNLAGLIQSIIGLDSAAHFKHQPLSPIHHTQTVATSSGVACPGPGYPTFNDPNNGFIPSQIAKAYNLNQLYSAGFNGEGQTVAVFELDDYSQSDINAYTACFGGKSVPIHKIAVDGGVPKIDYNQGAIEVELDMEMILSAAPHLAGLDVYEAAGNSAAQYIDEWAQIVNDAVPVVSTSWSYYGCEASVQQNDPPLFGQENSLFMLAAAQGQSIFAASGDLGTNACGAFLPPNGNPQIGVDDPASQPYITGVGGTSLLMNSSNDTYASETTWNNGPRAADNQGDQIVTAGGGGISTMWHMPSWQTGPGVTNSYTSSTPCASSSDGGTGNCREVPDVSLNADPYTGYEEYCTQPSCYGGWFPIGGTSAAAPMWAAFMALTNEKMLRDGGFDIGFLNPYLYQIDQGISGTSYANDFHDITTGNNDGLDDGGTTYPATANYDMATGLGSYNAWNLANDLEKLANAQNGSRGAPAATTWYFAEGSVGGGFQEYLTILNPGNTTATVDVTYLFQDKQSEMVPHTVAAHIRSTIDVDADLGVRVTDTQQAISAIVTSTVPIVAERPMYFNWHGIKSGTDVLGTTNDTNTTFYFAQGDTTQNSTENSSQFITILNPSQTDTAQITATFYSGGAVVDTQTESVLPLHRGTIVTSYHGRAAIAVTSNIGVVVERPLYEDDNIPTIGGVTSGAASTIGATSPESDWLFAEGHTGNGKNGDDFQEYLVLANFTQSTVTATINLEYTNGTVQTVTQQVAGQSQDYFDVNQAFNSPNCSPTCVPTEDVSAEVTSTGGPIVAERVMYFRQGGNTAGMSDVVGQAGPASQSTYSFAEGYTSNHFGEWLTLQNPTDKSEVVAVTFFADNTILQVEITLPKTSRHTIFVNDVIDPVAKAYPETSNGSDGFAVSIVVQAFGGGTVVVERPMYFTYSIGHNYATVTGGTDIIGYTGN